MSNKRITDLTELTTPTTDDVFPVVDIATNTTTKVQLGNLPTTTAVTTALATKENIITPGTTAQYFRGDKSFQTLDKTAVGLANVDNTSDSNKPVSTAQQTALNAKQDTLVSGTNIKTLNSTSLLGSGNIVLTANPSGVSGAIQFSNGSAFASDAANLFWDDTNKRLGIGTNAPTATGHFKGAGITASTFGLIVQNSAGATAFSIKDNGTTNASYIEGGTCWFNFLNSNSTCKFGASVSIGLNTDPTARLQVKGSGSTSATTSLLVQNSAGTTALNVRDDLTTLFFGALNLGNGNTIISQQSGNLRFEAVNSITSDIRINPFRQVNINNGSTYTAQASAILQVDSTTKGFLPPVMTTTQKNAIASPAAGLVVYDSTTNKLCCYNGSTWNDLF